MNDPKVLDLQPKVANPSRPRAAPAFVPRGFYAIVSIDGFAAASDPPPIAQAVTLAEKLITGGASVLQLRMKHAAIGTIWSVARELRELTLRAKVPFVVNDHLDLALTVLADGLHLGQEDLVETPVAMARAASRAAGHDLVIGVSTHNLEQVRAAITSGADHLGYGPVYATSTKENPDPVQGVAALAAAVRAAAPVPVVAIGGITVERALEVAQAGAAAACVISGVNAAADVTQAARTVAGAFGG